MYGLGGLPEGFSRLAAIHGGTYMLHKPVNRLVFDEDGKVCGIECPPDPEKLAAAAAEAVKTGEADADPEKPAAGPEVATAPLVICDPFYVAGSPKIRAVGKVIRAICVMTHPVKDTNDSASCQIIIPQRQLKRRSDVFILVVSSSHCVVPQGKFLAIVSTTVETSNPESELKPAYDLLGQVEAKFVTVSDMYVPTDDGAADNVFVSKSPDATSHFESVAEDVLDLYKRITGQELDMSIDPADLQQED